jgi:hypothetical protein
MATRIAVNSKKKVTHGSVFLGGKGDDEFVFDVPTGKRFKNVTLTWKGRYNPGARIVAQPSAGETGPNKRIKVHWWFDGGGNPLDGSDNPYIEYELKAVVEGVEEERAILVVCENTGYLKILDDILPDEIKPAAKRIVDFTAEVFEEANAHNIFDGYYKKVECLIDTDCKSTKIRDRIADLGKRYILDLAVLGHGRLDNNEAILTLHGDEKLKESDVRSWRNLGEFQGLKLGLVYMTNCQGSKFNDTWVTLGFKTSVGSNKNNYMPEPMFTIFWTEWLKGITAKEAAQRSWETARAIWQVVYIPNIRTKRINVFPFWEIVSTDHRYIRDSKPVVSGNNNFRITGTV